MNIAGIELGGTKIICTIGNENGDILDKAVFKTTTPKEVMPKVIEYFKDKNFVSLGIGSFGPIDPVLDSDTYGYITKTPKTGWMDYDVVGELKKHIDVPIKFETDVNGAVLAEKMWGHGKNLSNIMYITVGTGIGAGAIVNDKLVQGLMHPEMGHIVIKRNEKDNYEGKCPFHKDCLEGLAAGPAIEARWGKAGIDLVDNKEVWELEAYYLAQALVNYIMILSPQKIIIGGGVMKQNQLFPLIRENVKNMLNGYIYKDEIINKIGDYIVFPKLGDDAGVKGVIALGILANEEN